MLEAMLESMLEAMLEIKPHHRPVVQVGALGGDRLLTGGEPSMRRLARPLIAPAHHSDN